MIRAAILTVLLIGCDRSDPPRANEPACHVGESDCACLQRIFAYPDGGTALKYASLCEKKWGVP